MKSSSPLAARASSIALAVALLAPALAAAQNITTVNGKPVPKSRADALLLKVELHYCYAMAIPVIDDMVATIVALSLTASGDAEQIKDVACTVKNPVSGKRGIPIVSQAVVRITVPPVRSNFP